MKRLMPRFILFSYAIFVGIGAFGHSGPAQATLIDNGLTTIDTETGLEWLDVTLTQGQSYNTVLGGFGGYIADGYQYATTTQFCSLLISTFNEPLPNCDVPFTFGGNSDDEISLANEATMDSLISLFGDTCCLQEAGEFGLLSAGMFDSSDILDISDPGVFGTIGIGCLAGDTLACPSSPYSVFTDLDWGGSDGTNEFVGSWLVRPYAQIPEPSSMFLFGVGLIGLLGIGRRRRHRSDLAKPRR